MDSKTPVIFTEQPYRGSFCHVNTGRALAPAYVQSVDRANQTVEVLTLGYGDRLTATYTVDPEHLF